jgi:subtilase family serine protease
MTRSGFVFLTGVLVAAVVVPAGVASASGGRARAVGFEPICGGDFARLACQVEKIISPAGDADVPAAGVPVGWGAPDLQQAHQISGYSANSGKVAIIDVGADPNLDGDLATYRAQYGLPVCSAANGCLRQLSYDGGPALPPATAADDKDIDEQIGVETSLDVDMASASCPDCSLLEVQLPHSVLPKPGSDPAKTVSFDGYADAFGTAVQTAIAHGANAVSISYGIPGDDHMLHGSVAAQLSHRGVAIAASSGDAGFEGADFLWPQALPTVTAVGGTELVKESGRFTEGAWSTGGSSCAPGATSPEGQAASTASLCSGGRTGVDVSAVADNVAIYDSYSPSQHHALGWTVVAGTSASAPFIAGMYAARNNLATVLGPNTLYQAQPEAFHDITSGTNGAISNGRCVTVGDAHPETAAPTYDSRLCNAAKGWDGPTGLGSPFGFGAF